MEKELVSGKEHDVDLVIAEGKVTVIGKYSGSGGEAELKLSLSSDYLLDKLAAKIPGQIDDAIIEVMKAALRKI